MSKTIKLELVDLKNCIHPKVDKGKNFYGFALTCLVKYSQELEFVVESGKEFDLFLSLKDE